MTHLMISELHFHRNGCGGAGYYAGRGSWTPEDETFHITFVAFVSSDADATQAPGHIAIMQDGDISVGFRFEDFEADICKFIRSRGGQAVAFPHTIAG